MPLWNQTNGSKCPAQARFPRRDPNKPLVHNIKSRSSQYKIILIFCYAVVMRNYCYYPKKYRYANYVEMDFPLNIGYVLLLAGSGESRLNCCRGHTDSWTQFDGVVAGRNTRGSTDSYKVIGVAWPRHMHCGFAAGPMHWALVHTLQPSFMHYLCYGITKARIRHNL